MATEPPPRVLATDAALDLIDTLRRRHGPILFYQSGGCCDGSVPMCYADGDLLISDQDVLLGTIGGALFYVSALEFSYLKHTQLTIDATPGQGTAFSLDNGSGKGFVARSRLFTDDEAAALLAVGR